MLSGRAIAVLALVAACLTAIAVLRLDRGAPPPATQPAAPAPAVKPPPTAVPAVTLPPAPVADPQAPPAAPKKTARTPLKVSPEALTTAEWRAHLTARIVELEASINAERAALRAVTEPSFYNARLLTLRQNISQLAQLREELALISPPRP